MTHHAVRMHRNTYLDSVKQMAGSRAILETEGVDWGTVVIGTEANLALLEQEGFDPRSLEDVTANDLVLAGRGSAVEDAFDHADSIMFSSQAPSTEAVAGPSVRTLSEVTAGPDPPNLAVISVAGDYATLEAHKALSAGMDVMLFSDHVSIEDEIELKQRGERESRFVMGPGAGTVMIGGLGLGFANEVKDGPIGVVAAAGTGAQEVMTLIDRAGLGVTQVIGVGGRDLSDAVDGPMTSMAIRSFEDDPNTEAILLVSKPPSPRVASRILDRPSAKPLIAALIGLSEPITVPDHVTLASTLEKGVAAVCVALGEEPPRFGEGLTDVAAAAIHRIDPARTAIRGLFSGGTLCYEAMTLIAAQGHKVYSNTPLRAEWTLEAAPVDGHICLDLGEEEYTRSRPHPMLDPDARIELIEREGRAAETCVVLIDVVLGYGSHSDPAALLAPACSAVASREGGPQIVAYVVGTDADPQDIGRQRRQLQEVGCLVAPTNSRAAMLATAVATRAPEVSELHQFTR